MLKRKKQQARSIRKRLKLIRYLKGERKTLIRELERDMKMLSAEHKYEEAAVLRNRQRDLKQLGQQIIFSDREFMGIFSKDHGLAGLAKFVGIG